MRAFVQSSDRRGFRVDKGLHSQAHAIYAAAQQALEHGRRQRAGSALNGDLGAGTHIKLRA